MSLKPSCTLRYTLALALAMNGATQAIAQEASEEPLEEVAITGSRIRSAAGYESPTPLTVIDSDELFANTANSSLRETLATVPVFGVGYSTTTGNMIPSSNVAGISSVEMRNLGLLRTLVLFDGQRSVGAIATGQVDIDNFPEQLVKSVEVVTGGASAVYGSDAVAGVVNFILDRKFTGVKGEASGGITDYGDSLNYKIAMSAGTPFAGGRGHLLLSGEIVDNNGVYYGVGSRAWGPTTREYLANPAYTPTNGLPEYIVRDDVFLSNATHGGLITSGPLKGTAFAEGGRPYQFNYGIGLPRDFFMAGGDYRSTLTYDAYSLVPTQKRENLFSRVSFDITDNFNVYAQFSRGVSSGEGIAVPHYQAGNGPLVLSGNPFIPASVQARMTALNLPNIRIGTMNYDMPFVTTDTTRGANRYVVGMEGMFAAIGTDWSWSSYAQIGKTSSIQATNNARNNARYTLALDAVTGPRGQAVCRSTLTDPTNGCVPWNPMGLGVNTQAARDYILGTAYSLQSTRQDVYAASITGKPFENWAGPVSFALSGEYRKEHASVNPDPLSRVAGWHAGNHQFLDAGYRVKEAAIETLVPLASGMRFLDNWDLSAAFRKTDYEISGGVNTWKLGSTYAVTPELRFRATVSRDIRAPNISELFQAQNIGLTTTFDPVTNATVQHGRTQSGNAALKPEEADNFTAGIVLQPQFAPGLNVSVDYWKTEIKDAIRLIVAADIVRLCYLGYTSLCPGITRDANNAITNVNQQNYNLASQDASGLDLEASYRFRVDSLMKSVPGDVSLRLLASKYFENISDDGVTEPVDAIGGVNQPDLIATAALTYTLDKFSTTLTARYLADSVTSTTAVECETNCPTSTEAHRTYNEIDLPGATYFDLSLAYRLESLFGGDSASGRIFLNIRNLENEDPALIPSVGTTNVFYLYSRTGGRYDKLGRTYRLGMDFKF